MRTGSLVCHGFFSASSGSTCCKGVSSVSRSSLTRRKTPSASATLPTEPTCTRVSACMGICLAASRWPDAPTLTVPSGKTSLQTAPARPSSFKPAANSASRVGPAAWATVAHSSKAGTARRSHDLARAAKVGCGSAFNNVFRLFPWIALPRNRACYNKNLSKQSSRSLHVTRYYSRYPTPADQEPGLVVVPDTWRQLCVFAGRVFLHSAHHQLCEAGRGGRDLRVQPSQLDDPFLLVVCGLDRRRRHPVDHA